MPCWLVAALLLYLGGSVASRDPLLCYQCNKTDSTPCAEQFLLPCPTSKDRCVTHILKDKEQGFRIKRECGLAPCTFTDESAAKSLGMDKCDTSRDNFFCVSCCEHNGCNKDSSAAVQASLGLLVTAAMASLSRH